MRSVAALCFAVPLLVGMQEPSTGSLKGEELEAARILTKRASKALKMVAQIDASFIQTQSSALLEKPIVSSGTMHLRMEPACLLLGFSEPREILIRSDATSHQVYYPDKKRAERYLFESNEVAKALLSVFTSKIGDAERLFTYRSLSRSAGMTTLTLEPIAKKMRRSLTTLRLTFRDKDALLVRTGYANRDGDEVLIELSDIVLKPEGKGDDELFARTLPKDVKVVVHRVDPEPKKKR